MEKQVIIVVALVALIVLLWLFISIPAFIARARGISKTNLITVRILGICGLFFGVTWIVALILALVYPPELPADAPPDRGRGFEPVQPARRVLQPAGPPPIPPGAGGPGLETCENCGRVIGKLETPAIWQDHIVCNACHDTLTKNKVVSGC